MAPLPLPLPLPKQRHMTGTDHSFLVDATEDIDILCTNEMYTWSREDSYVALVEDLSAVFLYQLKGLVTAIVKLLISTYISSF